jgi:hypothetical protein
MRYILIFWGIPMGLIWGWYFLSYHDISFGMLMFSRPLHDFVFEIYGQILGVDPAILPGLLVRACIVDTALIFGIFAFRRRRELRAWFQRMRERHQASRALERSA